MNRKWLGVLVGVLSFGVLAAKDPVQWQKVGALPAETHVGNSYTLAYRLTNHLPTAIKVHTRLIEDGGDFSFNDPCNGKSLGTNAPCTITINYSPRVSGEGALHFEFSYGKNLIRSIPVLKSRVSEGEASDNVHATTLTLSPVTVISPASIYQFETTVVNKGVVGVLGYGAVVVDSSDYADVALDAAKSTCSIDSAHAKNLEANQSCLIVGTFTPKKANRIPTVSVSFHYDNDTKKTQTSAQSVISQGDAQCVVQAQTVLDFPLVDKQTVGVPQFSDSVLKFRFTNHCQSKAVTLGKVSIAASIAKVTQDQIIKTVGKDNCSNQSLAAQASCEVLASVIPKATGRLKVIASVDADGSRVSTETQADVIKNPYNHTVTFINQCPYTVWYGVSNAGGSTKTDPTSPDKPDDYRLLPPGTGINAKRVSFPQYNGFFYGRTACTTDGNGSLVCGQPNCPTKTGTGKCQVTDPQNPFTRLEMDFESAKNSDGIYNVSIINGFNLPVEFKGLAAFDNTSVTTNPNAPFTCAALGAPIQPKRNDGQLGSCTWKLTPPSGTLNSKTINANDFYLVTDVENKSDCKTANNCSAGNTCGMTFNDFVSGDFRLKRACGKVIGFWTVDNFCGIPSSNYFNNDQFSLFECGTKLNSLSGAKNYPSDPTVGDMYSCTPQGSDLGSCYDTNPAATCCGCKNWNAQGDYLTWQSTNCSANSDWATTTPLSFSPLNSVEWLKDGCPTSYVYPWDDKSSSASCNDTSSNASGSGLMDYQVVFCPGGESGI